MRQIITSYLLVFTALLASIQSAKAETITMMTLNVANQALTDRPDSPSFGNTAPWVYRKDEMLELIAFANADIIGLQEDSTDQRNDIAAYFSSKYNYIDYSYDFTISIGNDPTTGSHGTILYDKQKFTFVDKGEFPMLGARHGRWAKLNSNKDGTTFYIFNFHWFGSADDSTQQFMAEKVAENVWSRVGNNPFILVGDYNALIINQSVDYLLSNKSKYSDMSYHVDHQAMNYGGVSEWTSYNIFDDHTSISSGSNSGGIDHIITSPNIGPAYNYQRYWRLVQDAPEGACIFCNSTDHPTVTARIKISENDINLGPLYYFLLFDD